MPPVEPPASRWRLDLASAEPGEDLVGIGADLEPGTLLAAYRAGLFPMGTGRGGRPPVGWWSPDPRGVLPLDGLRTPRSLRKVVPRFEIRVDTAFAEVVRGCAAPNREGRWITPEVERAYGRLHRLGWAHSVECWQDGELAGGLYGVAVGGLFAGESMFHRVRDASKVALVALVGLLREGGEPTRRLLDVQWSTEHLARLGVVEVPRAEYLRRLRSALELPLPPAFG
ncbi:MAG TPA: leucyl/phenylalanyl-tRNA--protein transferase [Actinomycetales bacterium]|nr:leucyl/phenylalanyl-tRNA--protein transferase [Actinomycetales bacterium]